MLNVVHILYMLQILHIRTYCMNSWQVSHMLTIACTKPQQPIQTDIGATHVTQDGYNSITHNKQQKSMGLDTY